MRELQEVIQTIREVATNGASQEAIVALQTVGFRIIAETRERASSDAGQRCAECLDRFGLYFFDGASTDDEGKTTVRKGNPERAMRCLDMALHAAAEIPDRPEPELGPEPEPNDTDLPPPAPVGVSRAAWEPEPESGDVDWRK